MKKRYLLAFTTMFILNLQAQIFVDDGETVTVLEGTPMYFAGIDINPTGLLDIQSSTVVTDVTVNGEITGDENLSVGDRTALNLNNCTWTTSNDNTEILSNASLGSASTIEVPANSYLNISGAFSTASNNTNYLILRADATGWSQFNFGGAFANTGTAKVLHETYFSPATAQGSWRQLGTALNNVPWTEWMDDLNIQFDNAPITQQSIFFWDESPKGIAPFPLDAIGWSNVSNTGNIDDVYTLFNSTDPLHSVVNNPISINGDLVNAITVTHSNLTYTTDNKETGVEQNYGLIGGWNLIKNPFSANLSVTKLLDYVQGGSVFPLAYEAVHVWNASTQQYTALTITGGISNLDYNTAGGNINDLTIAPGQGFWVKTIDASGEDEQNNNEATRTLNPLGIAPVLSLHRAYIDLDGTSQNFLKKSPPSIRFIAVNTSDQTEDQTVIYFNDNAKDQEDQTDALKLFSSNKEIHSLYLGNKTPLSINNIPFPIGYKNVSLDFKSPKQKATFEIKTVFDEVNPSWVVQIEDKKTGQMHDVSNGQSFTFIYDPNFSNNRFKVHINPDGTSYIPFNRNVEYYNSMLNISQKDDIMYSINILDLGGNILFTSKNQNISENKIDLNFISENVKVLLVSITDANGTKGYKFFR